MCTELSPGIVLHFNCHRLPGTKALHTTATAQEVTFLTPRVAHLQLEFHVCPFPPIPSSVLTLPQRWNDPMLAPSPPGVVPHNPSYDNLFLTLPTPSKCMGLILNCFSRQCPIMYCTNDCIFPAAKVFNRCFYNFASPCDEVNVRQWINVSKGWCVCDSGHSSNGRFVFGSFRICLEGQNSVEGRVHLVAEG